MYVVSYKDALVSYISNCNCSLFWFVDFHQVVGQIIGKVGLDIREK